MAQPRNSVENWQCHSSAALCPLPLTERLFHWFSRCICCQTGVWHTSQVSYKCEEEKIDPRKEIVKMKGLYRGVCKSWKQKDGLLIHPANHSVRVAIMDKKLMFSSFAYRVFVYFWVNLFALRSWPFPPYFHIYHIQMSRWGGRQKQQEESNKQKAAFIKSKIGFQAADLYHPRDEKNGKITLRFPGCCCMNQLSRAAVLRYIICVAGWTASQTAALSSAGKWFLSQNLKFVESSKFKGLICGYIYKTSRKLFFHFGKNNKHKSFWWIKNISLKWFFKKWFIFLELGFCGKIINKYYFTCCTLNNLLQFFQQNYCDVCARSASGWIRSATARCCCFQMTVELL